MQTENTDNQSNNNNGVDMLDMSNYRIEHLPKREKSGFEKTLANIGIPLAILVFLLFGFVLDLPFLQNIDPETLVSDSSIAEFERIGSQAFSRNNAFMLAIFLMAIILWITQALPTIRPPSSSSSPWYLPGYCLKRRPMPS